MISEKRTADFHFIGQATSSQRNIHKVIHQENKGLVRASKRALAEAKGEYICFVDGDDYVDNNFCEDLLQLIHEYKADFVSTGYYQDDRISHKNNTKLLVLNDESRKGLIAEQIGTRIKYDVATSIWSKIFKAEFIKNVMKEFQIINHLVKICVARYIASWKQNVF